MSHDYYSDPRGQRPYGYPAHAPTPRAFGDQPLKHSGLGIASFAVAILSGIGDFLFLIVVGVIGASNPNIDDTSPLAMVVGLFLFALVGISFIGLGLGIVAVILPNRNKLFAWLGLVFNALVLLGVAGLVCVGLLLPD